MVHGNVWVKRGGLLGTQGATIFSGNRSTFFRNDNDHSMGGFEGYSRVNCSQYFTFAREGGTIEFLGHVCTGDEFMVDAGTVIVGPDSIVQPGRACRPYVGKGAVLALMDNAWFGNSTNTWDVPDLTLKGGTIQGGLKERPLKRSAQLGINFKNSGLAARPGEAPTRRVPSLLLLQGSTIQSFSADAKNAKFIIGSAGYFTIYIGDGTARLFPGDGEYNWYMGKGPEWKGKFAWFDNLPKGVDLFAESGVHVTGVELNGFRQGGVMVVSAAVIQSWKDVALSKGKDQKLDEMMSILTSVKGDGGY